MTKKNESSCLAMIMKYGKNNILSKSPHLNFKKCQTERKAGV